MIERPLAVMAWASLMLAAAAAAEEPGWFLEQPPYADRVELGADVLAPRNVLDAQPTLSLSGGYRFSEYFLLRATIRELVVDTERMARCMDGDFTCAVAAYASFDPTPGYSLSLVPAILLHDDLAFYGRLGIQEWSLMEIGESSLKKSELLFGIGIGYDVSNPLRLQLEYRSMDLDIKLTSIGFSWRF